MTPAYYGLVYKGNKYSCSGMMQFIRATSSPLFLNLQSKIMDVIERSKQTKIPLEVTHHDGFRVLERFNHKKDIEKFNKPSYLHISAVRKTLGLFACVIMLFSILTACTTPVTTIMTIFSKRGLKSFAYTATVTLFVYMACGALWIGKERCSTSPLALWFSSGNEVTAAACVAAFAISAVSGSFAAGMAQEGAKSSWQWWKGSAEVGKGSIAEDNSFFVPGYNLTLYNGSSHTNDLNHSIVA
ncbi:uncharacterized protein NDAI_0F01920 [Naumovozyma dairenensis CBS 421]|uniref:Uncharacterized protein n=1 Tax=Naumovozyma dairenensis (strain ATCC 10597 / BCRC 20456 / CBS 421 / NBRC 0211 / NRRL Y-12639) TaxID=1071378 RepID=G0WCJ9_NAUDC|nr:hypothetical protein NDAI_0F01920 [Naumovozyma dairenensis CBS 421]CCD25510.1 hypothetical protein NDAI_0F01920 [Naumovozyma dairenensis CBS 421]